MRRLTFLLVACHVFLPAAYASDVEPANPAGETLDIEQLPEGFVCRDVSASSCSRVGSLAWIGRTEAGTRFSLERLRGIELDFQKLVKPKAIDMSEAVIRVYGADGEQFEERTIRFGSPQRDLILDMRRSAEREAAYMGTDFHVQQSDLSNPISYAPIGVLLELGESNLCR